MKTRWSWVPVWILAAFVVAAAATLLFTTYMMYDDEGYVLYSLRTFVAGGGLYTRVYSQYGPFFFLLHQALHALGFAFTNTGARLITFVWWLGATGFCGAIAWRLTRSIAAVMFTVGGVFLHLWVMINEPSHPGGMITFVVAAVGWAGVRWAAQPRKLAVAVGLAGAALVFTKVNVGIFLLASAAAWWGLHLDAPHPSRRIRLAVIALAAAVLPVALMRAQIGQGWVLEFAVVASAAAVATVLAAARGATPLTHGRDLAYGAGPALVIGAITAAAIVAEGTSVRALLEGVILGPLRHPQVYTAAIRWRPGAETLALAGVAAAALAMARPTRGAAGAIAVARLLSAAVFFASWAWPIDWSLNGHAFALSYGLATTWLFVMPLGDDGATQPGRAWLGLVAVFQALHAYPVAGSQIGWGTFLWIPLAAAGSVDAVRLIRVTWPQVHPRWVAIGAVALSLGVLARTGQYAWIGGHRLRHSDALGLPGAAELQVPENFATTARILSRNAAAHADLLFTLPGMLSFHAWTDVPPPTTQNATHWFTLLSPDQQEAIRARLAGDPRSCVIVQRHIYQFLIDGGFATESPLTVWLKASYEPAFALDSYEFWVKKGRRIAAIGTAEAFEAAPGVVPRYRVAITLAEPDLPAVADLAVGVYAGDEVRPLATWDNRDAQFSVTPLTSAGAPSGPTLPARLPLAARGLIRLDVFTDRIPAGFDAEHGFIYLRNAAGDRIAEARFVH